MFKHTQFARRVLQFSQLLGALIGVCMVWHGAVLAQTKSVLAPAKKDPFAYPQVQLPKPKLLTPAFVPPPIPIAAPLPTPPALGMTYAGQMTNHQGQRFIFALYQDQMLTLSQGQQLPHGYVVQAIERNQVRFSYPALNATARLNIPELPTFEQR